MSVDVVADAVNEALSTAAVPDLSERTTFAVDALSTEQVLRCYVFEHCIDTSLEPAILIGNMQAYFDWIKDSKLLDSKTRKPKLVP
jgi:hypothetical protein